MLPIKSLQQILFPKYQQRYTGHLLVKIEHASVKCRASSTIEQNDCHGFDVTPGRNYTKQITKVFCLFSAWRKICFPVCHYRLHIHLKSGNMLYGLTGHKDTWGKLITICIITFYDVIWKPSIQKSLSFSPGRCWCCLSAFFSSEP